MDVSLLISESNSHETNDHKHALLGFLSNNNKEIVQCMFHMSDCMCVGGCRSRKVQSSRVSLHETISAVVVAGGGGNE
jgi:hypothetical protein